MKKILMFLLILLSYKPILSQCISGNCENGNGKFVYDWLDKYVGDWKNGLMHGQGAYTFANGDEYIGSFENGLRNGYGVYVKIDGEKISGTWDIFF